MNTPEKDSDKRREKRIPCFGTVLINDSLLCKTIDLSEGGLYVYTPNSIQEKSVVDVTFPLTNKNKFIVKAVVRHIQPEVGMGLQFINLDTDQKKMIKKLLEDVRKKAIGPQVNRKTVLLIEDKKMTRDIYSNRLSMEGFSVIGAKDGFEAIKLLKTVTPDLIVFNLNMGKMDGFKVLMILKSSVVWKKMPIIVFVAHATKDVIDRIVAAGVDEFLSKLTTSPLKLAETVKLVLNRRSLTGDADPV